MSARDSKTFGTELRRIRREAGQTLEDVAQVMGVSVPHVSDIERGRRSPPPKAMIERILRSLDHPEELDLLTELAIRHRGEFQREPRNANERRVLVALDRTLDNELSTMQYEEILHFLEKMRGAKNV